MFGNSQDSNEQRSRQQKTFFDGETSISSTIESVSYNNKKFSTRQYFRNCKQNIVEYKNTTATNCEETENLGETPIPLQLTEEKSVSSATVFVLNSSIGYYLAHRNCWKQQAFFSLR